MNLLFGNWFAEGLDNLRAPDDCAEIGAQALRRRDGFGGGRRRVRLRFWLSVGIRHRRDKSIAASRFADDEAKTGLTVAKKLANAADVDAKIGLVHVRRRPSRRQQVFFTDERAGPLRQSDQKVQSTAADRNLRVGVQKNPLRRDQPIRTECQRTMRRHESSKIVALRRTLRRFRCGMTEIAQVDGFAVAWPEKTRGREQRGNI
jgi:hypothetical protein